MKRVVALLLLLGLPLLIACPGGESGPDYSDALVLESPSEGVYVCGETGVTYIRYPAVYLPMEMATKPYAVYVNEHGTALPFFKLSEGSEKNYLMRADADDRYPYYIIAAEDYHMPTLPEMAPSQILVCSPEEERYWQSANLYGMVNTLKNVRDIVSAYENGEDAALPAGETPKGHAELVFVSTAYADLAYTLSYYEYADGSAYMVETDSGVCLRVEDGLLDEGVIWNWEEKPW